MIPSIGHASVLVGLGLTAYAAVAYFLVARGGDPRLAISARRAVIGSFLAAAVGCAAMIVSLLTHDFSVRYVAENNATTTPPFISVISLWAALEGSILFWALLATGWATLVLHRYRERHRHQAARQQGRRLRRYLRLGPEPMPDGEPEGHPKESHPRADD